MVLGPTNSGLRRLFQGEAAQSSGLVIAKQKHRCSLKINLPFRKKATAEHPDLLKHRRGCRFMQTVIALHQPGLFIPLQVMVEQPERSLLPVYSAGRQCPNRCQRKNRFRQ